MKKKLQVFISSTYQDLLEERQAAVEAVLGAGHIPAGMELFSAGDESQWDTIRKWIDDSDVFLLVLGGRYGSIRPGSKLSYIECEYRYAEETNKPLFAAVISGEYLEQKVRTVGSQVKEELNGVSLKSFREHVTSKICKFFSNLDQLKLAIVQSLKRFEDMNLDGWVRASETVNAVEILKQIAQLQAENALLREENQKYRERTEAASSLSDLSNAAKALLVAARDSGGVISCVEFDGGIQVNVGPLELVPVGDRRGEARWKAAVRELRENGLIEGRGSYGTESCLTHAGYELADKLVDEDFPVQRYLV